MYRWYIIDFIDVIDDFMRFEWKLQKKSLGFQFSSMKAAEIRSQNWNSLSLKTLAHLAPHRAKIWHIFHLSAENFFGTSAHPRSIHVYTSISDIYTSIYTSTHTHTLYHHKFFLTVLTQNKLLTRRNHHIFNKFTHTHTYIHIKRNIYIYIKKKKVKWWQQEKQQQRQRKNLRREEENVVLWRRRNDVRWKIEKKKRWKHQTW